MPTIIRPKSFWIVATLYMASFLFAIAQTLQWTHDHARVMSGGSQLLLVLSSWAPIFALVAVYHRYLWSRPTRELARVASLVHRGELPLDDLSGIGGSTGGMGQLSNVVREILQDLKQQKAAIAAVNLEMQQRVASKTESLERKLGSMKVQASRDPLTGLPNRRELNAELSRMIEQFQSVGTDGCALMIDVDHFKGLNDTLGHAAGDELLKAIAQIIRSTIRDGDHAFRCGGDEFVVLLRGCPIKAGLGMAERLASLVEQLTRPMRVVKPPTLSIGTCSLGESKATTPESMLKVADQRLYEVKAVRPRVSRAR